jgi:hypothetical protein
MRGTKTRLTTVALIAVALALPLAAVAEKPPKTTPDGLVLQPDTKLALVYLKPGADFRVYDRVALLDCAVAFKKNWQREQNRTNPLAVSKKDMDEIRTHLAELFAEVFKEEVEKGGHQLATSAAEDVLVLRPAIVDLDIAAPEAAEMGRSRTFATSAGEMTLYMEAYDSSSGELLARVLDRRAGRDWGHMMWQNSATNRTEAKKIFRDWATTLRQGLDRLKALPGPVPAAQ